MPVDGTRSPEKRVKRASLLGAPRMSGSLKFLKTTSSVVPAASTIFDQNGSACGAGKPTWQGTWGTSLVGIHHLLEGFMNSRLLSGFLFVVLDALLLSQHLLSIITRFLDVHIILYAEFYTSYRTSSMQQTI